MSMTHRPAAADGEHRGSVPCFAISRGDPETIAAMSEFYEMKKHPENYRRYASFQDAMNEVLADDV